VTEVKLPKNVSPALARFADVLCMYDLAVFSAQLALVLEGSPGPLDERAFMFRLTEQAIRVWAVELLEIQGRNADAETLRRLAPVTDRATARAAREAADALEGKPVGHARGAALFASCDSSDECAPARAAEHAAYAAAQTATAHANRDDARRVYDSAVAVLAALRAGRCSPDRNFEPLLNEW
jgi:hypothetical protein